MSERPEPASGAHDPAPVPPLFDALRERWQAEAGRLTTIGEIALTEGRLAGSSALALLAIALAGTLLSLVCWLLLAALVTLGLAAAGLGLAGALALVLGAHGIALLGLGLLARRLLGNLRFDHTLDALGRSRRRGARDERTEPQRSDRVAPPAEDTEPAPPA